MNKQDLIKIAVKNVTVHWSESSHVNKTLGCNKNFDIEKDFELDHLENVFSEAAALVPGGYDKTKLTVNFNNGEVFMVRMDINQECNSLVDLIAHYIN